MSDLLVTWTSTQPVGEALLRILDLAAVRFHFQSQWARSFAGSMSDWPILLFQVGTGEISFAELLARVDQDADLHSVVHMSLTPRSGGTEVAREHVVLPGGQADVVDTLAVPIRRLLDTVLCDAEWRAARAAIEAISTKLHDQIENLRDDESASSTS